MSKLAEKLAKRFKEEFDIEVDPVIYRTRAGSCQKSAGAWVWYMRKERDSMPSIEIGSPDRAADCAKAKNLVLNSWSSNEFEVWAD